MMNNNQKQKWTFMLGISAFALLHHVANFGLPHRQPLLWVLLSFLLSVVLFAGYALLFLELVQFFQKKYAGEEQQFRRLAITVSSMLITTGLFVYILLQAHQLLPGLYHPFSEINFLWNYLALGIITIVLTFVMEGIQSYRGLKQTLQETDKLNAAYHQSRLNALKSQVNPHFLFNSLNSLSSLIQEDEVAAENFLNEMTKVYRYMLRSDDEQLVSLETELKFINAYTHLLQARYGEALQIETEILPKHMNCLIPPLTLQVIIENAFTFNVVAKNMPLRIRIQSGTHMQLVICHNIQPKKIAGSIDMDAGLDNLVKKYRLMDAELLVEDTQQQQRIISIALIKKEMAGA